VDRVLVPDPAGNPRLVWDVTPIEAGRKALNARGHACGGLVLADPMGRAVLAGRTDDEGVRWDGRVVVTEGEPDFWTWSSRRERWGSIRDRQCTYAVLGIGAGGWSDAISGRIPEGATVIVRTHHDAAGDTYAERVAASLNQRARVFRAPKPSQGAP
jgi:hypothetical protein